MKPNLFAKWMLALKSDKYQQGKKYMRKDDTYCALGVLCNLSKEGKWIEDERNKGVYYYKVEDEKAVSFPPGAVINWAGMKKENADLMTAFVSQLNDKGRSFKEIAAALEKMYKAKK